VNKTLLILAAAGAALIFFRKAAAAGAAKLLFRGIRLSGKGLKRTLTLNFAVQNASNGSVNLRSITGEIYVNGKQIADFSNFKDQRISARSESPVSVNVSLSASILQLLFTKGWLKQGVNYQIKGISNIDNITAPFTYTGKLSA
jgi:hypothetical protein